MPPTPPATIAMKSATKTRKPISDTGKAAIFAPPGSEPAKEMLSRALTTKKMTMAAATPDQRDGQRLDHRKQYHVPRWRAHETEHRKALPLLLNIDPDTDREGHREPRPREDRDHEEQQAKVLFEPENAFYLGPLAADDIAEPLELRRKRSDARKVIGKEPNTAHIPVRSSGWRSRDCQSGNGLAPRDGLRGENDVGMGQGEPAGKDIGHAREGHRDVEFLLRARVA